MFKRTRNKGKATTNNKRLVFLLVLLVICIIGAWYLIFYQKKDGYKADIITTISDRSVKVNSYNNFNVMKTADNVKLLAQRDRIVMSEGNWFNISNIKTNPDYPNGFTAATLRSINPQAKTFIYYPLIVKGTGESDSWLTSGNATAASATTLTDTTKNWAAGTWVGKYIWIDSGAGKGQVKKILSNTANTITLSTSSTVTGFSVLPDSTSHYVITRSINPTNPPETLTSGMYFSDIEQNNWWLLDGKGNYITENGYNNRYVDIGASGFKEKFLSTILSRIQGKGYDGVVLDYWYPQITVFAGSALPNATYCDPADPTKWSNSIWYAKAWQPYIEYVTAGLHNAGYKVIGNAAGDYKAVPDPTKPIEAMQQWQRSKIDGVVYEQWVVGWKGEWLPGSTIGQRIDAYRNDPLDVWAADFGLRAENSFYNIAATSAIDTAPALKTIGQAFYLYYDNFTKFNISFKRVGTRSDYNLTFSVYATDANGLPTGLPIAQVSEGSAFISQIGDKTNLDVNFGKTAIANNKKYVLAIDQAGADASNYVTVWRSDDKFGGASYMELDGATSTWKTNSAFDFAMTVWSTGRQQRADLALAMYYMSLPETALSGNVIKTLNFNDSGLIFWEPNWDLNIGTPAGSYVKDSTRYFWSRDFTSGRVLMNYDTVDAQTTLSQSYTDVNGNVYSGTITIPSHSALVLKKIVSSAPVITITAPTNGASIANTVNLSSTVGSTSNLQKVNYYLDDNTLLGSVATAPFAVSWDSKTVPNGSHKISAQSISLTNNILASANIAVAVNNVVSDTIAPIVSITAPLSGATVIKNTTQNITVAAADNIAVTKVDFYVNSTLVASDAVLPYAFSWKTPGAKGKTYVLKARAYDAAGNSSVSSVQVISK